MVLVMLVSQFKRVRWDPNETQVWYVLILSFVSQYAIEPPFTVLQ